MVSEIENIPFDLSLNTLTLNHVNDDSETFTRVDEMVDCASYGWPTVTFRATVDGNVWHFTDPFLITQGTPVLSMGEMAAQGMLRFSGRVGGGREPAECPGCKELTIELQAGTLVVGSYDLSAGSGTGLFGRGTYVPDLAGSTSYVTDNGEPAEGAIVITSIGENHIRGTFAFTAVDGIGGGSVSVTDGVFDIVFN